MLWGTGTDALMTMVVDLHLHCMYHLETLTGRILVWRIGVEGEDKLLLDEDLWERFGWTSATKVDQH